MTHKQVLELCSHSKSHYLNYKDKEETSKEGLMTEVKSLQGRHTGICRLLFRESPHLSRDCSLLKMMKMKVLRKVENKFNQTSNHNNVCFSTPCFIKRNEVNLSLPQLRLDVLINLSSSAQRDGASMDSKVCKRYWTNIITFFSMQNVLMESLQVLPDIP